MSLILNGVTTVEANVIQWTLQSPSSTTGAEPAATLIANLPVTFRSITASAPAQANLPRIRMTLKGHDIWSNQGTELYYLDGQAFGQADIRSDGQTPKQGDEHREDTSKRQQTRQNEPPFGTHEGY